MAGSPVEAMTLIGLGFRTISMPPAQVGAVRAMIRSLDVAQLKGYLDTLFDLPDHSLRRKLTTYARDRGILVDDS